MIHPSVRRLAIARSFLSIVALALACGSALDATAQCVEPGVSIDSPPNPNINPFANQVVNTASTPQPVIIRLTPGTGALCITSITTTGDFAQTNNCGSLLPDGASCAINVTFTPKALGHRVGTLVISGVLAGSPVTFLDLNDRPI